MMSRPPEECDTAQSAGDGHPPDVPDERDTGSSDTEFEDAGNKKEETMKRLHEFEEISQKLLEELSILEAEFEINNASLGEEELYPTQLTNQNSACTESADALQDQPEVTQNQVADVDDDVLERDKKGLLRLEERPEDIQTSSKEDPEVTEAPADKTNEQLTKVLKDILIRGEDDQELPDRREDKSHDSQQLIKDPMPGVLNEDLAMFDNLIQEVTELSNDPAFQPQQPNNDPVLEVLNEDKENQEVTGATDDPAFQHQQPENVLVLTPVFQEVSEAVGKENEHAADRGADNDQQIKVIFTELQEIITSLMKEKQEAFLEKEDLKDQIRKLREEMEIERMEGKSLLKVLSNNEKTFKKLSRVSMMVTHEYNEMMQQLELEQSLRQEAELFAHAMLKEQQAANRQSMILMQNLEPNVMLLRALEEVRKLTNSLEETKQDLESKLVNLESELVKRPSQEEFELIQEELKAAHMEKCHLQHHLKKIAQRYSLLEEKVKVMEEKVKEEIGRTGEQFTAAPSPPIPPPVPPPPPPCRSFKVTESPVALIQQRSGMKTPGRDTLKRCEDLKTEAVKEMMERIKHGIVLKPVRRDGQSHYAAVNKRKSVINELHGILDTMRKPGRRTSIRRTSRKVTENELEGVLGRRRRIVDESVEKQQESNLKDDITPTLPPRSMDKSPILIQMRHRKSSLLKSKRNALAIGDAKGQ
ncbi:shootin-1-like isoform X2 [Spea bombifrons]|uniref:shootin-1-like isoform X2 n=1 Tax=Spea bombifrons TaxID=233779 RepID=UPI0023498C22|nr:shootin-1-like isoform X2 [Spea bombifrons]